MVAGPGLLVAKNRQASGHGALICTIYTHSTSYVRQWFLPLFCSIKLRFPSGCPFTHTLPTSTLVCVADTSPCNVSAGITPNYSVDRVDSSLLDDNTRRCDFSTGLGDPTESIPPLSCRLFPPSLTDILP